MNWLIITTADRREYRVAQAITELGFDAWVPSELRHWRTKGRKRHRTMQEAPLLPRTLFAAVPCSEASQIAKIRHCTGVEYGADLVPLLIPNSQVMRFMDYCTAAMERERARITTGGRAKPKAQWVRLGADQLPAIMQRMFGADKVEIAA